MHIKYEESENSPMLHISGVEAIQWVLHCSKDNPAFHGCERRGV
jgi:hypothetical protein